MGTTQTSSPRRRGRPGYDVETLLQVAVDVFTVKGFDGTSMEDLSRKLGITKSAIYHHVSSKDQLLELAVSRALDGLSEVVDETLRMDASAVERLEHLIRGSVRVLVASKPFVTLLLRVRGNTAVERRALQRRRSFDHMVADLVAQAIDEGDIRPDIKPDISARLLFGMVNSLVEWVKPPKNGEVGDLADAVWSIAYNGLRGS
ncbi:MAG TPA: TetR/AcrR family transcriptional regulator [Jatrophihabitans sp.]|nr:TetR/AcrR family transcriptional regulator [Jatrophihabitans sp.]